MTAVVLAAALVAGTVVVQSASATASGVAGREGYTAGLDESFGIQGRARLWLVGEASPVRFLMPPTGGTLLAAGSSDGRVFRLDVRGRPDKDYAGWLVPPAPRALPFTVGAASLDPRGRVVVAGSLARDLSLGRFAYEPAVGRLTASGSPDRSFGSKGVAVIGTVGDGFVASVRADQQRILAASRLSGPSGRLVLAAFRTDGSPDVGYTPAGVTALPVVPGASAPVLDGADGALFAFGTVFAPPGKQLVLARYGASGTLRSDFGTHGVVRSRLLADADSVLPTGAQQAPLLVARADRRTGTVTIARLTADGALDPSFGVHGIARIRLGTAPVDASLARLPGGGVAAVAGIRGALAASVLDRFGRPARSFGAGGVQCLAFGGDSELPAVFRPIAAAGDRGLTVAATVRESDTNDITVARFRWHAPRGLACVSSALRGRNIRFSAVQALAGRLELALHAVGPSGRPGRLVGTVRFERRHAGARADLWNQRLRGQRVRCQDLVALPRLRSASGRIVGVDAPLALRPNCPGPVV